MINYTAEVFGTAMLLHIGHTHKPRIERDEQGRLLINPGETSGWTFGRPTIMLFETAARKATVIDLQPSESGIPCGAAP